MQDKVVHLTRETRFFGPRRDDARANCAYRAGLPVSDALDHAATLVDSVQGSLEDLALLGDHHRKDWPVQMLWTMSYVLETAKAAIAAAQTTPDENLKSA